MTPPITLNRTRFGDCMLAILRDEGRPVHICTELLKLWCGDARPTGDLLGWLKESGMEIAESGDGWDVRMKEEFQLR